MQIEELAPRDAPRLIPLLQDLHSLHATRQPERYPADPDEQQLTSWLETWLGEETVTALAAQSPQGALLGYVIFGLEQRPALPLRKGSRRVMVHHIAVASAFRRMGVGSALLAEVKTRATAMEADSIATSYAPFNTASQALFRGIGLEPAIIFAEAQL